MTTEKVGPYLKYALFCRDTEEGPGDELAPKGVIDLVDLPAPVEASVEDPLAPAEVEVYLVFCTSGSSPGPRHLPVARHAPLAPPDPGGPNGPPWLARRDPRDSAQGLRVEDFDAAYAHDEPDNRVAEKQSCPDTNGSTEEPAAEAVSTFDISHLRRTERLEQGRLRGQTLGGVQGAGIHSVGQRGWREEHEAQ